MTKEEREDAIRSVRMAFAIWEDEYDTGEDWSGEHKARDRAIEALKQDSILDQIIAEIEALPKTYPFVNHIDMYVKVSDVMKIIGKYKAESEDGE